MNHAVIGVGSNIRPEENIESARHRIASEHRLIAESAFVETEPIGYENQPKFLNGAFRIETNLDFQSLKEWLTETEEALGRKRGKNKYGPRTIDLDIVVWNGTIVDDDFHSRKFLKDAVLEVWPGVEK